MIERKRVTIIAEISIDTDKYDIDGLMLCLDIATNTCLDQPPVLVAHGEGFEVVEYEQFDVKDLPDEPRRL
jgi:hypothetical protein